MSILSDQPINDKTEDTLNRSTFAEHLADGILQWKSDHSFCIALHGPWGSGKTSLINLCLQEINKRTTQLPPEEQPITLRFQPWLISGQEHLIKAFLSQLRTRLNQPNLSEHAHKAAQYLGIYETLFDVAAWVPPVSGVAQVLRNITKKLKGRADTLAKALEQDIDANKESICKALSSLHGPVIIIMDDVDRLNSHEIRQLFQVIKAIADFPKTIYLLAFDFSHVHKALENFQLGSETSYLEKMVQLAIEIPHPTPSALTAVLWDGLDTIAQSIPPGKHEEARWNEIRFGPLPALFRNIRDIKRYLNSVNFMFPMLRGEVSSIDLLIMEAIHIFAPSVYDTIRNNGDYLVSDSPSSMFRSRGDKENKEKVDWVNNLPGLAPPQFRQEIKELLSHLFPEIESIFDKHGWGSESLSIWEKNQRLCISSFFNYYLQATTPEGEISAKEIRRVLDSLYDKSTIGDKMRPYFSDGRIKKLLPKIQYHFEDNFNEEHLENLMIAFFECGESIPLKPEMMFDLPIDWAITGTIYRLVKQVERGRRKDLMLAAIRKSQKAILFPVSLTSFIWREWNPREGEDSKKEDEDRLLSHDDTEDLKNTALDLLRKHRDLDVLYKARHLMSIMYDWERWASLDEVRQWVDTVVSNREKIPEFLGGCGGFTASSGMGSQYARYQFKINLEDLKRFCDMNKLVEKCKELVESEETWFTENYKAVVNVFLKSVEGVNEDEEN